MPGLQSQCSTMYTKTVNVDFAVDLAMLPAHLADRLRRINARTVEVDQNRISFTGGLFGSGGSRVENNYACAWLCLNPTYSQAAVTGRKWPIHLRSTYPTPGRNPNRSRGKIRFRAVRQAFACVKSSASGFCATPKRVLPWHTPVGAIG